MTQIHIMLDIETWGKEPGCDVRSIGACAFAPDVGVALDFRDGTIAGTRPNEGDTFYLATMNPMVDWQDSVHYSAAPEFGFSGIGTKLCHKYPLTRDPATVQWWSEQSPEAQAAFANPVDLREALGAFTRWIIRVTGEYAISANLCLWSHGPAFDVAILAAAYKATGLPVPWHYRAPRDTRTAFDVAGVGDHSRFMARYNHGTAHNALDDAISQARAVCGAYQMISARFADAFHAGFDAKSVAADAEAPLTADQAFDGYRAMLNAKSA